EAGAAGAAGARRGRGVLPAEVVHALSPHPRQAVRSGLATRSSRLRTLNSAMLGRCHLTPPGVNGRAAAASAGSRRACARPTPTSASAFPPARTLGDTCRPAMWRPPGCAHVAAQPPESPERSSGRPELDSELYRE